MKVYVVTADVYGGRYGAEIYLYAVCTTEGKARQFIADNNMRSDYCDVNEMELDELKPTYLGGYIE